MVDFFFYLCIDPLQSAMSVVLHRAYHLTDSWGLSLIFLSLTVNIALIPLYHLAETWQEAERDIQTRMAPKLAEIKSVFTGRERHMYVRALYRLHGYRPVHALRTSFGLLIQIPFFFAAYHLLNAAPELAGASWLFLRDLARPDALLSLGGLSVNLLPLVMTAANLASAAVYTARLSRRDTIRLYALAALFLVLLYSSSAALLLYWTCNNLFSLGKNLIYTRFVYCRAGIAAHPDKSVARAEPAPPPQEKRHSPANGRTDVALALGGAALFVLSLLSLRKLGFTAPALSLAAGASLATLAALGLRIHALRRGASRQGGAASGMTRHYGIIPALLAAVVVLCVWKLTSFKKVGEPLPWVFYRFYAVSIGAFAGWIFSREPLQPLLCGLAAFCQKRLTPKTANSLYTASCLVMAALVCWYTPAALYASDPDFFHESLGALTGRLSFRALVFLLVCRMLHAFTHASMRPFLGCLFAWAALCALLYTFAAAGDYGTMDEFILQDPSLLKTRLAFLVDLAVMAAAATILYLCLARAALTSLTLFLQGAALALSLAAAWQFFNAPPKPERAYAAAATRLPDYNDELFGFSHQGRNVLVIMLDMFTGSHLGRILETDPGLRQGLDGFIWYQDTIAPGATTLLSISALLGGEAYTPPAVNARKPASLKEELHRGFATLPDIFIPAGYAVALGDIDELVPSLFAKTCGSAEATLLAGKSLTTAYTGYWREKMGLPSPLPESLAPFSASVGLFRAAPWVIRNHIYYDGSWLDTRTVHHNPSEGPYAMLDVLPEVANAEREGNTLKFIASQVSHYPWRLDEDSCLPVERKGGYTIGADRVIREHVAAERCALKALARWFDWMKQQGIYDNTLIILVSDHDGNDSAVFGAAFDRFRPPKTPWKPDALLLVKQYGSRGELIGDERPMSSADVVPLICKAEGLCPEGAYPDPLRATDETRIRTHSSGLASIRRHASNAFVTTNFSITGNSKDPANWTPMEPRP